MMIILSVADTVNLQDKQYKIKLPAQFWSWKINWNKRLFFFSSQMLSLCSSEPQALAAVGRTKSHFHCCQSHSQTPWRKPTSHNFITEVLLSSAITSAKFTTEKHFPLKESDFQCSLASIVYPGPSLVFTLTSSVFLWARNHADLNCNGQKCNLPDKLDKEK